jgi:hypothetical protein
MSLKRVGAFFDARPWYFRFAYYALAFGIGSFFLLSDRSAEWAAVSGLAFATLMTLFDGLWRRMRKVD